MDGQNDTEQLKVRYSIDKQRRVILTTAEGIVMFDDIKGHQDRLLADPDFDVGFDQLIDATAAENIDISADEARVLASRPIVSPESRRAIVAAQPHVFGLGRMMEVYHWPRAHVEVFYSMDEAAKWLENADRLR